MIILQAETMHPEHKPTTIAFLPEELLVEIFIYHWRENFPNCTCRPELTLSHVNQCWRAISIATPRLWTRVNRLASQKRLEPIAAYLARSKQMPIDLVVVMSPDTLDDISELCVVIQPHLHLLRKFEFHDYSQATGGTLFRMMTTLHAPFLQFMHLSPEWHYRDSANGQTTLFEGGVPRLNYVSLNKVIQPGLAFPHHSVTHLMLRLDLYKGNKEESYSWITAQLTGCPQLVYLDIGVLPWQQDWVHSGISALPTLLTLECKAIDWAGAASLLRAFSLSALQRLCINFCGNLCADTPIGQFDLPSLCTLALSYPSFPWRQQPFHSAAEAFPQITELSLCSFGAASAAKALCTFLCTAGTRDGRPWPHVDTLGMDSVPPCEQLSAMLAQRALEGHSVARLQIPKHSISDCEKVVRGLSAPVSVEEFGHEKPFSKGARDCLGITPVSAQGH